MIRYWRKHPESDRYGRSNGQQFFDKLRTNWENRSHRNADAPRNSRQDDRSTRHTEESSTEKTNQQEIDRILDKIRRSGYDSLTDEEKRKLFESGN